MNSGFKTNISYKEIYIYCEIIINRGVPIFMVHLKHEN